MPYGCEPRGSAIVRTTTRVAGSITLIVADCLLATQIRPSRATARVRGAAPTGTSASLWRVTMSNAVTESLSGLTTHACALPAGGRSVAMLDDIAGASSVVGR